MDTGYVNDRIPGLPQSTPSGITRMNGLGRLDIPAGPGLRQRRPPYGARRGGLAACPASIDLVVSEVEAAR